MWTIDGEKTETTTTTAEVEVVPTAAAERERGEDLGLTGEALDLFVKAGAHRRHEMRVRIAQDALMEVGKAAIPPEEVRMNGAGARLDALATRLAILAGKLDAGGIGGRFGCGGDATARLPGLRQCGKGRKQASDGGAWTAALEGAITSLLRGIGDTGWGRPGNFEVRIDPTDGVCGVWDRDWEVVEVKDLPAAWMPWMEADASRAIIWMAQGAPPNQGLYVVEGEETKDPHYGSRVPAPVLRWEPQAASWMLAFGPEHRRLTAELEHCRSTEAAVRGGFGDTEDGSAEEEDLSEQLDLARDATARAEEELEEFLRRMCPVSSCTPPQGKDIPEFLRRHLAEAARVVEGWVFPRLVLGNGIEVSIQGSKFNYSEPRADLDHLSEYEQVELAAFWPSGKWMLPGKGLPDNLDMFETGMSSSVAAYVAVEDLPRIIEVLEAVQPEDELRGEGAQEAEGE